MQGLRFGRRSRNTNLYVYGNLHRRQASGIVTRLIAKRDRDSCRPRGALASAISRSFKVTLPV